MSKATSRFSFREQWETAWRDIASDPIDGGTNNEWWEGRQAYKELLCGGRIRRVLPGEGSPMLCLLLKHLRHQRRFIADTLPETRAYGEIIQTFHKASVLFRKQACKAGPLKDELEGWAHRMEGERAGREHQRQQYWYRRLLPYDRVKWGGSYDVKEAHVFKYEDIHLVIPTFPAPRQEIAEVEAIFNRVRYPSDYTSRANLETWLQLRAAVIFKLFLSQPCELSLLTASRLVVLFYGCAGLGAPYSPDVHGKKAYLKLKDTSRKLSVNGLYEKLQRYGVDKILLSGSPDPAVLKRAYPFGTQTTGLANHTARHLTVKGGIYSAEKSLYRRVK